MTATLRRCKSTLAGRHSGASEAGCSRRTSSFSAWRRVTDKHFAELGEPSAWNRACAVLAGAKVFGGALARQARLHLHFTPATWHHRCASGRVGSLKDEPRPLLLRRAEVVCGKPRCPSGRLRVLLIFALGVQQFLCLLDTSRRSSQQPTTMIAFNRKAARRNISCTMEPLIRFGPIARRHERRAWGHTSKQSEPSGDDLTNNFIGTLKLVIPCRRKT